MMTSRCPICDQVMQGQSIREWPQFPFCSPRCKLIDLGRWLSERYRIAAETEGEAPATHDENDPP